MNTYPWLSGFLDRCTRSKVIRPVGHLTLVMYYRFVYSIPYKLAYLKARLQQNDTFTILCYPICPDSLYILYKLAHLLGCRVTCDPKLAYDLVVHFEDM